MQYKRKKFLCEYKPYKLIYMGIESPAVRAYFFDKRICDLMAQGLDTEALELTQKITGRKRVGIEIVQRKCVYPLGYEVGE